MSPPSIVSAPRRASARSRDGRWPGVVMLSLGVSLVIVDATIINVLLHQVIKDLSLTTTGAEWVASVYPLMFAALLIPFGRAGDVFGRRRMFIIGTVLFVATSLAVAASDNALTLVGSRALQGVGASMIMPATLSTLNSIFTGRDRAVAFGIWGSIIGGMTALGPLLGGWLASSFSWRWAFTVNLPIGVLLVIGVLRTVPETKDASAGRGIDWRGGLLAAFGLSALVGGLIEGQTYGWWLPTRPLSLGPLQWPFTGLSPIPVALALGVVLIGALITVEHTRARSGRTVMLDLELFRIVSFRRGNVVSSLISVGELGLLFVLPLFLQNAHDNSPLQVSVAILPLAAGVFLCGPYAGRLSHHYGAARIVQLGMALEVTAVFAIGLTLHTTTTGLGLAPWMLLYGIGLGLTSAQLTNLSLADVPRSRSGQASGTQSTARQIGSALGIALIGTVFATSLSHAMLDRLKGTGVTEAKRVAMAQRLRDSAGTSAGDLRARPGAGPQADAAVESVAVATRYAVFTTAAILGMGLVMTLRLGQGGVRRPVVHPEETAT